jgi:hypothetical protein
LTVEAAHVVEDLVAEVDGLTRRREAGGGEEGFGGVDMVSVDLDRARSQHAEAAVRLAEIDAGLARLDAGTYGWCEDCGGPIGRARLEAIAEAARCVICQAHPRRLHHRSD